MKWSHVDTIFATLYLTICIVGIVHNLQFPKDHAVNDMLKTVWFIGIGAWALVLLTRIAYWKGRKHK